MSLWQQFRLPATPTRSQEIARVVRALERLPDDEELVLLAKDGECWLGWHDGDEWLADDAAPLSGVTHWARMERQP